MVDWSRSKSFAFFSAAVSCWISGTTLSSPVYAETLLYRADRNTEQQSSDEPDESPYALRRRNQETTTAALPSPDLLKQDLPADSGSSISDEPAAPVTSESHLEPTRITIPNLRAMQEQKTAESPTAEAFKPIALDDDRPSQTVAEFKPILLVQPTMPPEQLAALSPAAGTDAPLIIAPDAPPVPAAAPPAPPSAASETATTTASAAIVQPPLPPLPVAEPASTAPTDDIPSAIIAEAPPTAALDHALRNNVPTAGKSGAPEALPLLDLPIEEKAKPAAKKQAKKPAAPKEPEPDKAYSPLDSEPEKTLSDESKKMAQRIPSNIDKPSRLPTEEVVIDRAKDLDNVFKDEIDVKKGGDVQNVEHEAMGIKIKVSNRSPNLDYELEKAYDALVSGQPSLAMEIYKNVLTNDPRNKGALFGLATTYHRSGQLDQARSNYAKLLAIDPKHRDGLNNFLVLLADEAPEQALTKMEELARRNPDFSPIPAQMAVIRQRLGQHDEAIEQMFKAVALAPENLVYRYNLAIMLDKQKKYDEAARLYKQIIEASSRGMVIPGNLQKIQQRLTFISSNR